jgi:single-strand DNA-binding protein
MAATLNKVILMGNLGKDPETRTLETGVVMTRFSLATSERFKNKQTGEKNSHTEWHNIVLWRSLAEVADKYLKKGDKILIEGRIRTRSWEDKESGQTRYSTEVLGDQMQMISTKKNEKSPQPSQENDSESFVQESSSETHHDLPF